MRGSPDHITLEPPSGRRCAEERNAFPCSDRPPLPSAALLTDSNRSEPFRPSFPFRAALLPPRSRHPPQGSPRATPPSLRLRLRISKAGRGGGWLGGGGLRSCKCRSRLAGLRKWCAGGVRGSCAARATVARATPAGHSSLSSTPCPTIPRRAGTHLRASPQEVGAQGVVAGRARGPQPQMRFDGVHGVAGVHRVVDGGDGPGVPRVRTEGRGGGRGHGDVGGVPRHCAGGREAGREGHAGRQKAVEEVRLGAVLCNTTEWVRVRGPKSFGGGGTRGGTPHLRRGGCRKSGGSSGYWRL